MSNNTMPFSSDEQIKKSYEFFKSMDKPACPGCQRGVRMCKHTPCMGTVEDMEKIINAGYAKQLMLDWWVGEGSKNKSMKATLGVDIPTKLSSKDRWNPFSEDVGYLAPALIGKGGQKAPFSKTGTCNFLIDDKCSLHDKGLKPIQGQFACCKLDRVYIENGKEQDLDERLLILHTWNSQRGKDLIERWKKEVNYGEDDGADVPLTFPDMIDSLFNILLSHTNMHEELPEDPRPVVKKVYDKPY